MKPCTVCLWKKGKKESFHVISIDFLSVRIKLGIMITWGLPRPQGIAVRVPNELFQSPAVLGRCWRHSKGFILSSPFQAQVFTSPAGSWWIATYVPVSNTRFSWDVSWPPSLIGTCSSCSPKGFGLFSGVLTTLRDNVLWVLHPLYMLRWLLCFFSKVLEPEHSFFQFITLKSHNVLIPP